MSVKASERGESPIEFLKVLRDLEVYFIRLASNKPKKFRFFLNDELLKISADAYNNAKAGNSIYPTTKMEKDLRAKYFYTAFCNVQMMISQTEVLSTPLIFVMWVLMALPSYHANDCNGLRLQSVFKSIICGTVSPQMKNIGSNNKQKKAIEEYETNRFCKDSINNC